MVAGGCCNNVERYTVGNPGYHNVGIPGFQTDGVLYATAASLKAIHCLIVSATYDFLFVFHSNYGPSSYHFRIKAIFAEFSPLGCI